MIVESEDGHTMRFLKGCDFRISPDQRSVLVDVAPSFEDGLVPILLSGSVLAALLVLQGECVLHASGVHLDGWTLGILAGSGQGKSTLAALFCSVGAELVSDDLLRVEISNGRPRCYTGTAQIRLRSKVVTLADAFPNNERCVTADGRTAVTPNQAHGPLLNINTVVVPLPSREVHQARVMRLSKRDAFLSLLRYPRVLGWETIDPIRRHFEICAEIAEVVPVFEATIPWGPPFPPSFRKR